MEDKKDAIIVALLTLTTYFLSVLPATRPTINSMFVLYVFVLTVGLAYWPFAKKLLQNKAVKDMYFYLILISALLLVGVTGWFFSPFFYFLYLIAIIIGFTFSAFATMLFIIVLVGIFVPNIGSIDFTIDIITLISLFSVVPLTYFLQREYLNLKQAQNKVLILEDEKKDVKNKVDEVLANKVSKFSVDLRQPVNDIRQLAMVAMDSKKKKKAEQALHKIVVLGREALDQVETFEEEVTGKKLVHQKKKK